MIQDRREYLRKYMRERRAEAKANWYIKGGCFVQDGMTTA